MCGRFALFAAGEEVAERFQLPEPPLLDARYNIAPSQTVVAVRSTDEGREARFLRWGLIPSWASNPIIAYQLSNAWSDTVSQKPSFRSAFKQRRCLIPASAYYEWVHGNGKIKQPYCIRPRDGGLFAIAGLWERWNNPEGQPVETCTIVTTEANELMRPLHDRMPVILDKSGEDVWLDTRSATDELRSLFVPFSSDELETFPVSSFVSNAKNQGPQCLEPA